MIDPAVERQIVDLTELVDAWRRYLDLITPAFADASSITQDQEHEFMETKARIAMLHDSFVEAVPRDRNIAQNMMALVNRSITLHHLVRLSEADRKKIEIEWHEAFLLLNETVSTLQEKKEELEDINEFTHNIKKRVRRSWSATMRFLKGPIFKGVVVVVVLVVLGFFVPRWRGQDSWADMHLDPSFAGGFIGTVYDFTRGTLGIELPFSNIEIFVEQKLNPETAPDGFTLEGAPNQMTASGFASELSRIDVNGVDGATFLANAKGTHDRGVRVQGSNQPAALFAYWFEKDDDAQAFAMAHNGQAPSLGGQVANTTAFTIQNVLVIVYHPEEGARTRIQNELF